MKIISLVPGEICKSVRVVPRKKLVKEHLFKNYFLN